MKRFLFMVPPFFTASFRTAVSRTIVFLLSSVLLITSVVHSDRPNDGFFPLSENHSKAKSARGITPVFSDPALWSYRLPVLLPSHRFNNLFGITIILFLYNKIFIKLCLRTIIRRFPSMVNRFFTKKNRNS